MASIQWAADLDGIDDLEADLSLIDCDKWTCDPLVEPCSLGATPQRFSDTQGIGVTGGGGGGGISKIERLSIPLPPVIMDPSSSGEGIREVLVLSPNSMKESVLDRIRSAPSIPNPFDFCTVYDASEGEEAMGQTYFFEEEANRVLKVFFPCLRVDPVYFLLHSVPSCRATGGDVLKALLYQVFRRKREEFFFSSDVTLYDLYVSNSKGDPIEKVELNSCIQKHNEFCVFPGDVKSVILLNQGKELPPIPHDDIRLTVHVFYPSYYEGDEYECVAPADMRTEDLEKFITRVLPNIDIIPGSLGILYRGTVLNPKEEIDLGVGVGSRAGPLGFQTLLTLYRCGLREVEVQGILKV